MKIVMYFAWKFEGAGDACGLFAVVRIGGMFARSSG
jgi:hypothetical protein